MLSLRFGQDNGQRQALSVLMRLRRLDPSTLHPNRPNNGIFPIELNGKGYTLRIDARQNALVLESCEKIKTLSGSVPEMTIIYRPNRTPELQVTQHSQEDRAQPFQESLPQLPESELKGALQNLHSQLSVPPVSKAPVQVSKAKMNELLAEHLHSLTPSFWNVGYERGAGFDGGEWTITPAVEDTASFQSITYTYQGPHDERGWNPFKMDKYHWYDETRETVSVVLNNGQAFSWSGISDCKGGKKDPKGHHFPELRRDLEHWANQSGGLGQKYGIVLPEGTRHEFGRYRIPDQQAAAVRDNLEWLVRPGTVNVRPEPHRNATHGNAGKWVITPKGEGAVFQSIMHAYNGPIEEVEIVFRDGEQVSWSDVNRKGGRIGRPKDGIHLAAFRELLKQMVLEQNARAAGDVWKDDD
jgi:hypothetical protein